MHHLLYKEFARSFVCGDYHSDLLLMCTI